MDNTNMIPLTTIYMPNPLLKKSTHDIHVYFINDFNKLREYLEYYYHDKHAFEDEILSVVGIDTLVKPALRSNRRKCSIILFGSLLFISVKVYLLEEAEEG